MSIEVSASSDRILRSANLPTSSAITMAAWVKILAHTGNGTEQLLQHRATSPPQTSMHYDSASTANRLWYSGNFDNFAAAFTLNTWIYVAFTASGTAIGTVKGYWGATASALAANVKSNTVAAATYTPNGMSVLSHISSNGEQTNGRVAYCRVWDAVLTITELQTEMVSTTIVRTANINTAFTGIAGSAADVSGNGRNWTLTGTVSSGDDPLVSSGGSSPGARYLLSAKTGWEL